MTASKILCLSDLHGCAHTMLSMIEKHGKGRQLIFLGDLIDRGARSKQVVEYAMENNIPTCAGNHEDFSLAYSGHAKMGYKAKCTCYYDRDVWMWNGGDDTLKSWGTKTLPRKVLDWMSSLPAYIKIEAPNSEGRKLFCSHTGYGMDADKGNWIRALWGRYPEAGEFTYEAGTGKEIDDGWFRCYGHSRVKMVQIENNQVNIDTGCAYKGYGILSGLLWPEGEIVQVPNID